VETILGNAHVIIDKSNIMSPARHSDQLGAVIELKMGQGFFFNLSFFKIYGSRMGEIGNMGNLNLKNYCISFCNQYINIDNYHISFLKMLPFEVRNVEIKMLQFDII